MRHFSAVAITQSENRCGMLRTNRRVAHVIDHMYLHSASSDGSQDTEVTIHLVAWQELPGN